MFRSPSLSRSGCRFLVTLLFLLGIALPVTRSFAAATSAPAWIGYYTGPAPVSNSGDGGTGVGEDSEGNVYVAGWSIAAGSQTDYVLVKFDPQGTTLWTRRYNGAANQYDSASDLIIDADDNVVVTGTSIGLTGRGNVVTLKYGPDGTLLWESRYEGNGQQNLGGGKLKLDSAGNIYVAGQQDQNFLCLKYAPNGAFLWARTYDGPDRLYDLLRGFAVDAAQNVYLTGNSSSTQGQTIATIRYDAAGALKWVQRYPTLNSSSQGIDVDALGNVYVGGSAPNGGPENDFLILKYDASGNLLWEQFYPALSGEGSVQAIAVLEDGNLVASGSSNGADQTVETFKLQPDGTLLWRNAFRSSNLYTSLQAIAHDYAGHVYLAGSVNPGGFVRDWFSAILDTDGTLLWSHTLSSQNGQDDYPQAMILAPSGRILVTGHLFRTRLPENASDQDLAVAVYENPVLDLIAPTCQQTGAGLDDQSRSYLEYVVRDGRSGIGAVEALQAQNVAVTTGAGGTGFAAGAPEVPVRVTRLSAAQRGSVTLRITDVAENVTLCQALLNTAPTAQDAAAPILEDTPTTVSLGATDPEGDALTYSIAAGPAHGSLSGTGMSRTYTPNANYFGPDSFTFQAHDGLVQSAAATVSLTVQPANDPPTAAPQSKSTAEDTAVGITLAGADLDGDPLTFQVTAGPAHGALSGTVPTLTYTPAADYNGPDSFTFTASDGALTSAPATVTLTVTAVNDAPRPQDDVYLVLEDTPRGVAAGAGVLANDLDPEGGALTSVVVTGPAHGNLMLQAGGSFTYTPALDYWGPDSFTYRVSDPQAASSVATVTLNVQAVNDAPAATAQSVITSEDTARAIQLSGTDVDGDLLTYQLAQPPAHGAVTGTPPSVTYTPAPDYAGPDSFTFQANDGQALSAAATVALTITPVNDPPEAANDAYGLAEDTMVTVAAPGVLANDSDVEGDALTALLTAGPAHGVLTLQPSGSFTYTPTGNYTGPDSFTYRVKDPANAQSGLATVSLTVQPANDPPVATPQSVTTAEDTPRDVTLSGTDVEGSALSYSLEQPPAHGTVAFPAGGPAGRVTYAPDANYTGADQFTFRATDGAAFSAPAAVNVTVTPVNDPPVGRGDAYALNEDVALAVASPGVLANDTDLEGSSLTVLLGTGPTHGALTLLADGGFTYVPTANYHGPDSFTYRCSDGVAQGAEAMVQLTVAAVNDPPVAAGQAVTVVEDTPKGVTLAAVDVDGDPLTYELDQAPAHGTLSFSANGAPGSAVYTPGANYTGADRFTFRVTDGTAASTAAVSLTVTPVNDPPVGRTEGFAGDEDTTLTVSAPGVLANDVDVEGDSLTAALGTGPAHGALTLAANGSFTYVPAPDYHGPDAFTYRCSDGTTLSAETTVQLTVTPVNDAPVALGQTVSTAEDTTKELTLAGSDVDGDALTFTVVQGPAHGTLSGSAPSLTYTPAANYYGADSFTFRASDGAAQSTPAAVQLAVTSVNDAPVSVADQYSTSRGTMLTVPAAGVLTNDADPEGDVLTAQRVGDPSHGQLTLNADGGFTYTPALHFQGTDTFTYRAADGTAASAPVTVSLVVSADPPQGGTSGKVSGSGALGTGSTRSKLTLSASRDTRGRLKGSFTYRDGATGRQWKSTRITSLIISGSRARVFGFARQGTAPESLFVVDVTDGNAADEVAIETADGLKVPPSPLASGKLTVIR